MAHIAGLNIANCSMEEATERIRELVHGVGGRMVVTANPEICVEAHQNKTYGSILQKADLIFPDGVGIVLASYLTKEPLTKGRITGVDLVEKLVAESSSFGYSVFLVGGDVDVLQKATHNLFLTHGKINIVGQESGPRFSSIEDLNSGELLAFNNKLLEKITQIKPDVLLIAFGHPKQELWLNRYLPFLPVKVGMGVGGTFNFLSGEVRRAPKPLRSLGLEWLWRLFVEPWRWKRIIRACLVFPWLFLGELIKSLFHIEH